MKALVFFKSPIGNLVLFLAFLAMGGLMLFRNHARDKGQENEMSRIETKDTGVIQESLQRVMSPFKPGPSPKPFKPVDNGDSINSSEANYSASQNRANHPNDSTASKPRILPLSLIAVTKPSTEDSDLSKTFAPYGRLIPCETVITLESSKLETPLVGLVTEDVWYNGRLVIPAGAEVHGRASLDRSRERISASGRWVIVWNDASVMNGTELVLTGIALEREKKDTTGEFGLRDGSAGLIGDLLRTDDLQEVRLFASTFIAGIASGLQQTQTETSAFGITQIATGSARDGALRGTSDVLNAYAHQIQEAISRDGFFVRVPAGKQFYIYVTETIDQARSTRGNRSVEELWKKKNDN